jgi:hypothetical protein
MKLLSHFYIVKASEREDKKRIMEWFDLLKCCPQDLLKMRSLMRKSGVPSRFRWSVWREVAEYEEYFKPGLYESLKRNIMQYPVIWSLESSRTAFNDASSENSRRSSRSDISETIGQIKRDLFRTFPDSLFYANPVHVSQLGDLIAVYAITNKVSIGYTQGMNFLAGILLQICKSEEEAFWMLTMIMNRYNLEGLYREGLPLLHLIVYQFMFLLQATCPDAHRHLDELQVTSEMFAVKWFFSMFAYSFSFETIVDLWDFMLSASPPNQLHTGFVRSFILLSLAIMKVARKNVLHESTSEGVISILTSSNLPSKQILKIARDLDSRIPQGMLEILRSQWASENPELNALITEGELRAITPPPMHAN